MRLATSRFLGRSRNLVVNAYGVRSVNGATLGQGLVLRRVGATIPTTKSSRRSRFEEIQENFRPALGFVQRDNARLLRIGASYNPRPRFLNIQQMFHDVYYTRFTRLDNKQVESWDLYIAPLDWHLRSGDSVHAVVDVNPTYERLFERFEIAPRRDPACPASIGSFDTGAC